MNKYARFIPYIISRIAVIILAFTGLVFFSGTIWGDEFPGWKKEDVLYSNLGPNDTEDFFNYKYLIQNIYTECNHHNYQETDILPEYLTELNISVEPNEGATLQDISMPEGWSVYNFEDRIIFTNIRDVCPDCLKNNYLGNHKGKIAIFRGFPSAGVMYEELDYEVKEIHKRALDKGVPFYTNEELKNLLESYTS